MAKNNHSEIKTHSLGYPRIGAHRELKKATEAYWKGQVSLDELLATGRSLRQAHWETQRAAGIDLIPVNDFSFYDQVLDFLRQPYVDLCLSKQEEFCPPDDE